MSDFQPLEVVGRGSETQRQVGGSLNKLTLIALIAITAVVSICFISRSHHC